jgi:hypothetical protein
LAQQTWLPGTAELAEPFAVKNAGPGCVRSATIIEEADYSKLAEYDEEID